MAASLGSLPQQTNLKFLDSMSPLTPSADLFNTTMATSNTSSYSAPIESPVSTDDLDILSYVPSGFDSFDHETLLSSELGDADEFNMDDIENTEKWHIPSLESTVSKFKWNLEADNVQSKPQVAQVTTSAEGHCKIPLQTSKSLPGKKQSLSVVSIWTGVNKSKKSVSVSELSDNSDMMEDEEKPTGKGPVSKNLVSERRRRRKLNEKLYSLRALVPKISKMDKASIVSDAINYVTELQSQVRDMENDINVLQSWMQNSGKVNSQEGVNPVKNIKQGVKAKRQMLEHKVLEFEVAQMEEDTYNLRIHCKKGPGLVVQLTKALEHLDFEIVNANLSSVNEHVLNTIVVKVRSDLCHNCEDVKSMVLSVIPKFGLVY